MTHTIADVLAHVKIYPEDLGMATLIEKMPRQESVIAVITHPDKTKQVISLG